MREAQQLRFPFMEGVFHRAWIYQSNGLSSPLDFPSPSSLVSGFTLTRQKLMESFSSDWDETFEYLSREILASEVIETDLQQQVPTPPVRCFGPLALTSATELTLLWVCPRKRHRISSRLVLRRVQPLSLSRPHSYQGLN
jgi:hypothetical protein